VSAERVLAQLLRVVALALAVVAPAGGSEFQSSPHLVPLVDPPSCDVVVTPANAATTLNLFNDPAKRVFCVDPGDYRSAGLIWLYRSGTPATPRVLRFNGPGATKAIQRSQQAIFEQLQISGSWWVVQGLTFRPRDPETTAIVAVSPGDHVVLDGNLIDGIEHPNGASQVGVLIVGSSGDPATHNTVQSNVIRDGNQSRLPIDYTGVLIASGFNAGENNDWNAVLDNEIVDWGDGIGLGGYTSDCSEPGLQHGTVIDGNDIYVRSGKRVDCASGEPDPAGDCSCTENGIDVKPDPGADPALWTRVTNNRVWGFRPASPAAACGGSGALGQAITAGNQCPGHVFVARNLVGDSTIGIEAVGPGWIVAGNLLHDIRAADGNPYTTAAILPTAGATALDIQFNTIVRADVAYDDTSNDTETRCNVVLDSPALTGPGQPRGANHTTLDNWLYQAPGYNFGAGNPSFASVVQSQNADLCYWRRRWTGAERVCVGWAATTPQSPHSGQTLSCDAAIGAPFGMPTIGWWKRDTAGCGIGAELVAVLAVVSRRRRYHRAGRTLP